ncbi:MAG: hypothetical protein NW220_19335 [Leptolyngbyaceae cyanobacterium bins.349]|nr:hypothetical protein [Leptolyngbyaceae cyanobacterium bins.349]
MPCSQFWFASCPPPPIAPMVESSEVQSKPQFPVTIWETIAIVLGALLLVVMGVAGLMYKFFNNAADPQRATLIAQSLMDYQLPGASQGVFGANLGGAKVAIVSSTTFPQNPAMLSDSEIADLSGVELFIARVPLDMETANPASPTPAPTPAIPPDPFSSPDFSFSYRSGEEFRAMTSRTEELPFCYSKVPVRIQAGELILADALEPVYAVKYDAIAVFENSKRQVTVTAIGKNAEQQAAAVFNSLRCK